MRRVLHVVFEGPLAHLTSQPVDGAQLLLPPAGMTAEEFSARLATALAPVRLGQRRYRADLEEVTAAYEVVCGRGPLDPFSLAAYRSGRDLEVVATRVPHLRVDRQRALAATPVQAPSGHVLGMAAAAQVELDQLPAGRASTDQVGALLWAVGRSPGCPRILAVVHDVQAGLFFSGTVEPGRVASLLRPHTRLLVAAGVTGVEGRQVDALLAAGSLAGWHPADVDVDAHIGRVVEAARSVPGAPMLARQVARTAATLAGCSR